jgi:hypothetical protein
LRSRRCARLELEELAAGCDIEIAACIDIQMIDEDSLIGPYGVLPMVTVTDRVALESEFGFDDQSIARFFG